MWLLYRIILFQRTFSLAFHPDNSVWGKHCLHFTDEEPESHRRHVALSRSSSEPELPSTVESHRCQVPLAFQVCCVHPTGASTVQCPQLMWCWLFQEQEANHQLPNGFILHLLPHLGSHLGPELCLSPLGSPLQHLIQSLTQMSRIFANWINVASLHFLKKRGLD